ncbi:site-specific integrase [Enterocloster clostridioformis]
MFKPLLITIATGCRISELIALQFSNINVRTGVLRIETQLGKDIYSEQKEGELYKQHLKVKSFSGERMILLSKFIIDEIILAAARNDILKKTIPEYQDNEYIWCQQNGLPHGRGDYAKPFKRLKKKVNLPEEFHWHDLRHSYCTLMVQNGANLKQLSIAMGHYSELFSLSVYTDMDFISCNGFPEFDAFIDDVLPTPLEPEDYVVNVTMNFDFIDSVIPA